MARKGPPKRGRPPKEFVSRVQLRILDAAQQLFLEKGYRSVSIEDIAERAPASKPTIYAHFPGKQALFAAAVSHTLIGLTDIENFSPHGRTIEDKLVDLGIAIVEQMIAESLRVVRATIAEANRFPELSRNVHDTARNHYVSAVYQLLTESAHQTAQEAKGPLSDDCTIETAQIFLDLILLPMLFRSLAGETSTDLKKELPDFVRDRVDFFLSGPQAVSAGLQPRQ